MPEKNEPRKIDLKYGKFILELNLPAGADLLNIKDPSKAVDDTVFAREVSAALPGEAGQLERIAVIVADKTRRCGYEKYLPLLVKQLLDAGVQKNCITFYIAYGTHAAQSREECFDVYGSLYGEYNFVHHDSTDASLFEYCCKTLRGTRVHIRKDILGSDLIITFGALSHHYFAGYGGGRKLLFPGLGYRPDIYQNHSLFLDGQTGRLASGCRPGNLDGNPLADDLKEIDGFLPVPRIAIHGILNSKAEVCRLIVAHEWEQFISACSRLDACYKSVADKNYELVIASCGGYPKDINFIQAHKAINNAAMFVKEGGSLVVLAQCPEGIGSDAFIEYFGFQGFDEAFEVIHKAYKGNGGTALSIMSKTERINIFLKTGLDDTVCRTIGVTKIDDRQVAGLIHRYGHDMAVIENAGLLIR